jgi:hypothetical protein
MLAASLLVLLFGACFALRHYAIHVEPNRVEITRHEVACPDLPPELDGLVIAQVSDLHITAKRRNQEALAAAVRAVEADLYVLTGDMIFLQTGVAPFFQWADALGDAMRPAIAVLGNAENKTYVDRGSVERGLAARGIPLLNNRCMRVPVRGAAVQVVGVDDPHTRHSDFAAAYADADLAAWTLLLCHSPDGVVDLAGRRADLMLCGHTHGGQFRLPLIGALRANTRRVRGLVSGWYSGEELARKARGPVGSTRLYVSRGLGMSGFRFRFLCPPELPLFTLVRAPHTNP